VFKEIFLLSLKIFSSPLPVNSLTIVFTTTTTAIAAATAATAFRRRLA
jgi:hypothetical protein